MNPNNEREIELVFGKTGSGKSTYTKKKIKEYKRVLVIDPKEEYDGLVFTDLNTLINYYIINVNDGIEYFTFVCRFKDDEDIENLFNFCEIIEDVLLVVEECQYYISPRSSSTNFLNLVKYGRHHKVSILGIARRPSELSTDLKGNCDKITCFKLTLPNDLNMMKEYGLENLEKLEVGECKSVDL